MQSVDPRFQRNPAIPARQCHIYRIRVGLKPFPSLNPFLLFYMTIFVKFTNLNWHIKGLEILEDIIRERGSTGIPPLGSLEPKCLVNLRQNHFLGNPANTRNDNDNALWQLLACKTLPVL